MSSITWGILSYLILAAIANVAGGLIIFIKKIWSDRALHALMAISAGLLLSIAILELIPDVAESNKFNPVYILLGMLLIFFLERWMPHSHSPNDTQEIINTKSALVGSFFGMMMHTFFDGFAIVVSFEMDTSLGIMVLIAIILHKIPDGVTISSIVFSISKDKGKAILSALAMGVMTVAGGFAAWFITGFFANGDTVLVIALSLTAGIFLYISAVDLLPIINHSRERLVTLSFILSILAYLIMQWLLDMLPVTGH